jgi:hypothetical protein
MSSEQLEAERKTKRDGGVSFTQDFLAERFSYIDGVLYWKERSRSHFKNAGTWASWNNQRAGKPAGFVNRGGYLRVFFMGRKWNVHNLIYAFVHGPYEGIIDHADGNPLNNQISNLRLTNRLGNVRNRAPNKACKHLKGAYPTGGIWYSRIGIAKKSIYLGSFKTEQEAHQAYVAASNKYFGEFARHE